MKPFLLLFTLHLTFLFAENSETLIQNTNNKLYKIQIEKKLTDILKKIKIYKNVKENEINQLQIKMTQMEQEFKKYRQLKEKELKTLKHKLKASYKKKTSPLPEVTPIINKPITTIPHVLVHKVITESIPTTKISWLKVTVENNLNIYDLALKYYGDAQQYEKIYTANQDIIGEDYQITNDMQLKIPLSNNFEKAPFILKQK